MSTVLATNRVERKRSLRATSWAERDKSCRVLETADTYPTLVRLGSKSHQGRAWLARNLVHGREKISFFDIFAGFQFGLGDQTPENKGAGGKDVPRVNMGDLQPDFGEIGCIGVVPQGEGKQVNFMSMAGSCRESHDTRANCIFVARGNGQDILRDARRACVDVQGKEIIASSVHAGLWRWAVHWTVVVIGPKGAPKRWISANENLARRTPFFRTSRFTTLRSLAPTTWCRQSGFLSPNLVGIARVLDLPSEGYFSTRAQLSNPDLANEMGWTPKRIRRRCLRYRGSIRRHLRDFVLGGAWEEALWNTGPSYRTSLTLFKDRIAHDPRTHGAAFAPIVPGRP
ncbi:hypothetical protein BDN72DRAFT_866000 [Pluteus cervinus]|uniref:Uncharacterized protein n=1 Tax=Pluteus cervinus TaxID=181527 RepID=A0ACD2ZYJ6_9AGAR|nr:hypothetical protein BDN72DRAFT_866000 [Pluteus cervinus]